MSQKAIELILTRQLASYLAMPIFLVDPDGTLIYYNEPAEAILGRRFEETGEMPASEWATIFTPTDESGASLPPQGLPLMVALVERRPDHRRFWICGLDGARRHLDVTAFPIIGQDQRHLGAIALFWEVAA
jgi:PAS domain-containing protein